MLRKAHDLQGFSLGANDGEIGSAREFYFDDQSWVVRYLVADTGKWLPRQQVLISPLAITGVQEKDKRLDLNLTRKQIEQSPPIDSDQPVSRQFEMQYYEYYNYPYYWNTPVGWGPLPRPVGAYLGEQPVKEQGAKENRGDPHLRSSKAVKGYYVQARDGEIGHVEDLIINDHGWAIEYLVIDTVNWWPGKKVLVPPVWAREIDWTSSRVFFDLDRGTIKNAPEYEPSWPITRDFEQKLFAHYGQKPYWADKAA